MNTNIILPFKLKKISIVCSWGRGINEQQETSCQKHDVNNGIYAVWFTEFYYIQLPNFVASNTWFIRRTILHALATILPQPSYTNPKTSLLQIKGMLASVNMTSQTFLAITTCTEHLATNIKQDWQIWKGKWIQIS